MFGGSEVNINFPFNIPVHLTYQSAYVDDAGKLVIREDVYGRDARVIAALKGSERRVAPDNSDGPAEAELRRTGAGSPGHLWRGNKHERRLLILRPAVRRACAGGRPAEAGAAAALGRAERQ